MEGLTEGRIVHYVDADGNHHPATVTLIYNHKVGEVKLFVLDGSHEATYWQHAFYKEVGEHEKATPYSWHWIEKA